MNKMTSRNNELLETLPWKFSFMLLHIFHSANCIFNQFVLSTDSKHVGSLWGRVDKYFSRICSDSERTVFFFILAE